MTTSPKNSNAFRSYINEPASTGCDPTALWRVRSLYNESSRAFEIEIGFYCRNKKKTKVRVPAADRADYDKIRRVLESQNARLPADKAKALEFVICLVQATPRQAITCTCKAGWRNEGRTFVAPTKVYGISADRFMWDSDAEPTFFGAISGSLKTYSKNVLEVAMQSPHLTLAILIGLSSPMVGYVAGRLKKRIIPETAVVHWGGETSTGKTTLIRVTQSVMGPPSELVDYRASERGLAEECHKRNDLTVCVDEAEHGDASLPYMHRLMTMLGRTIPGGTSRAIARSSRRSLHRLTWTNFGVSSGPYLQANLAANIHQLRNGQQARFFDIAVAAAIEGGIFARGPWTVRSETRDLFATVSRTIERHHGVLMDAWLTYLVEYDDVAQRCVTYSEAFLAQLAPGAEPLEQRIASKFALWLAVAKIGIEADILPWRVDWPLEALRHLHQLARETRDPHAAEIDRMIREISDRWDDEAAFPRIQATRKGTPPLRLGPLAIGFAIVSGQTEWRYIIPTRLGVLGLESDEVRDRVAYRILDRDRVGNQGPSRQFRVDRQSEDQNEDDPKKVRAWPISLQSVRKVVDHAE